MTLKTLIKISVLCIIGVLFLKLVGIGGSALILTSAVMGLFVGLVVAIREDK